MNQIQNLPHNPAESYDLGWNAEALECFGRFNEIVEAYRGVGVTLCEETASFAARRLAKCLEEFDAECERRNAEQKETRREC